ncbi:MAG: hypothetical protein SW833_00800 [Cyanobacteriota bacterium]|nr:hypothetical protein [Cyanobacteriota bacterium]
MDELYREIAALDRKVDRLYAIVKQLSQQLSELLSQNPPRAVGDAQSFETVPLTSRKNVDSIMQHKDILAEETPWDSPPDYEQSREVSPELQIRRLTAQVTAAYNRIAILEEQLLAQRIHS